MSFATRTFLFVASALAALALVAFAGWYGVQRQNAHLSESLHEYAVIREGSEAGVDIMRARDALLRQSPPDVSVARRHLAAAATSLSPSASSSPRASAPAVRGAMLSRVRAALESLGDPSEAHIAVAAAELNGALGLIAGTTAEARDQIHRSELDAIRDRSLAGAAVLAVFGAAAVGLVVMALLQWRAVVMPLRRLAQATRTAVDRPEAPTVEAAGDREFVRVAQDFNTMCVRWRDLRRDLEQRVEMRSRQLARSDRLASVGLMAAGVAHEVNNPLGIIAGQAELALRACSTGSGGDRLQPRLEAIRDEAFRCKQVTDRLLTLTRRRAPCRERVDLWEVISDATVLLSAEAERLGVALILHDARSDKHRAISGDPVELRQVVTNLTMNALRATPAGGRVAVRLGCLPDAVRMTVTDTGAGMSPHVMGKAFEPLFTTRRGRQSPGTGLGLSVCRMITESHGGVIEAFSDGPGCGSRFVVDLPAEARAAVSGEVT